MLGSLFAHIDRLVGIPEVQLFGTELDAGPVCGCVHETFRISNRSAALLCADESFGMGGAYVFL